MNNKLRFIKSVIYKMKRSYGLPIDYYQASSHTLDVEDGDKVTTLIKTRIQRAVVLRAREFQSFVYDLAFISANKDFTTGGYFDPEDRRVIIDRSDVPISFEPAVDDYYIFQNRKYEVKEILSYEDDYAYIMLARRLKGAELVRIEDALSVIDLQQAASSIIVDQLERSPESVLTLTHTLGEVP
jgi:hypothetical protein